MFFNTSLLAGLKLRYPDSLTKILAPAFFTEGWQIGYLLLVQFIPDTKFHKSVLYPTVSQITYFESLFISHCINSAG